MHYDDNGKYVGRTLREIYTTVDGKKHGHYQEFYDTGVPSVETNYVNGKRNGYYISWCDGGKQYEIRCHYINGKLDGLYERWHYGGNKWFECNYVNGKLEGIRNTWHEDSTLLKTEVYKANKLVEVLYEKTNPKN